jgi:hypothetical protein
MSYLVALFTRSHALWRVIMNVHSWPFFSHALSRFATPLFVKLVQCHVVRGCSFHVVTHCHASSVITSGNSWPFFFTRRSCWCFITHGHSFSRVVTLSHAWPHFVPFLYSLLNLFLPFRSFAIFTLSRIITLCHALSRVMVEWSLLTVGCYVSHPYPCIFTRGHP